MSDKNQEILLLMFKYYGQLDEELLDLYITRLNEFEPAKVKKQILNLIDTEKYMPKLSQILDGLIEKKPDIKTQAELNWPVFYKNALTRHPEQRIEWVETIKSYIGRMRCEDCTNDDLPWIKKEYLDYYQSLTSTNQINAPLIALNNPIKQISC